MFFILVSAFPVFCTGIFCPFFCMAGMHVSVRRAIINTGNCRPKDDLPLSLHRNRFRGFLPGTFHQGGFGGFTPNVKARRCRPRTSSPPIPTRLRLRLSRCVVKGVPHLGAHQVSIGFNAHWEEPRGGFESRVLHNMSTGTPESRDIDVGNHQADGVGHLVHVDDLERCVVVVWTSRKQQRTT